MKCHFEQKAARLIFCPDFQSDLLLNEPNEAIFRSPLRPAMD